MIYWAWLILSFISGIAIGAGIGVNCTLDWILKKLRE